MLAYVATFENDKEEMTTRIVGGMNIAQAARKATEAEDAKIGECIDVKRTEVIL